MMCPTCKEKLVIIGSHQFCKSCNFMAFHMSDSYLYACAEVIAAICNTMEFLSEEDFMIFVLRMIKTHLPVLYSHIENILQGREDFIKHLCELVKQKVKYIKINPNKFRCICGSTEYEIVDEVC